MTEPVTLTVGTIAALAFTKFLESSTVEAAKKLTPAVLSKMDTLRRKIWARLKGIPEMDELSVAVESSGQVTENQIQTLTPYLESLMKSDALFAQEVQQLAREINQEINIDEVLGENVQNIYAGSAVQINKPNAPVFQGVSDSTINITYN